ncbi:hypothetical protein H2198_010493 [Neophaeococcomyces mojaviensis]|uniref:Uncharacterized protein n=1 Tax=Neophaeococcomyces mojaviensis TaxID=3383035 RepID=A0ACC2ZRP3_9EURO|nr:hypothetical protein H2198_010493 [Knufia sp. JES_112]
MSYSLKDRKVLITGGSKGLGWAIAQKFAAQGSHIAINYASDTEKARTASDTLRQQYGVRTHICQGDMSDASDIQNVVASTTDALGGLDVIVSNTAWTRFSSFADLDALSDEEWEKCYRINVLGSLRLMKAAKKIFESNPDGGVFLYTASTAGASISGSSMAYSVTKAAGLQLMKCLAQTQGPYIRVNSVLPGLLLTDWEFIRDWEKATPLKSIPEVSHCADMYVSIAQNKSMTGQQIEIGMSAQSTLSKIGVSVLRANSHDLGNRLRLVTHPLMNKISNSQHLGD